MRQLGLDESTGAVECQADASVAITIKRLNLACVVLG